MTIKLRSFNESDWYARPGAVKFEDGSEPLIGYVKVRGWPENLRESDIQVIADGQGITLNGSGLRAVKNTTVLGAGWNVPVAMAVIQNFENPLPFSELEHLGFEVNQ
jgi:hypothetical protein